MLLANFNIQGCIVEQIISYLANNSLTFEQIKQILLDKKPVLEIHTKISTLLSQAKNKDVAQIISTLELQAYNNQVAIDLNNEKKEQERMLKNERLAARFNEELKHIAISMKTVQMKQQLVMNKMHPFYVPQIPLVQTAHSSIQVINQWQNSLHQYDIKIHFLSEKRRLIQAKLAQLEQQTTLSRQSQSERFARAQARTSYLITKQGIEDTLSPRSKEALKININQHIKLLDTQCMKLAAQVEHEQFPLLLNQLSQCLSLMSLKANEVTAIHAILKLIKQHLQYNADIVVYQKSIHKKKEVINSLLIQIHNLKKKHQLLRDENPTLTLKQHQLTKQTSEYHKALEKNTHLKQKLSTAALLLLGLTCLFSIPLILALSGTLSFWTPILLYSLVSTPPVLLFLSTLSVALASGVYFFRARANSTLIKNENILLESTINKINKSELEINELQLVTLPRLEDQLTKEENLHQELTQLLEKTIQLSTQIVTQVQTINPAQLKDLSVFKSPSNEASLNEVTLTNALI